MFSAHLNIVDARSARVVHRSMDGRIPFATSVPGTNGVPSTFTLNGATCAKV